MGCVKANQVDENEAFRAQQKAQWAKVDAERHEREQHGGPRHDPRTDPKPEPVPVATVSDEEANAMGLAWEHEQERKSVLKEFGYDMDTTSKECGGVFRKQKADIKAYREARRAHEEFKQANCPFRDFSTGQVVYTRVDSRGRVYQQIGGNAGSGYDCKGVKFPKELQGVDDSKDPDRFPSKEVRKCLAESPRPDPCARDKFGKIPRECL